MHRCALRRVSRLHARPRHSACIRARSSSSRRRPRRWRRRCGSRSSGWRRWRRTSSRSPMAPAARPASAPTRRVKRILTETTLTPAAHLTCVGGDPRRGRRRGAQLSRRRRPPHRGAARRSGRAAPATRYAPHPGGYAQCRRSGRRHQARIGDFEVSVSAYPEKHPDSPTVDADIDMLKRKVDAGATRAITQFFFENDLYFRYLDRVRARGIAIPIVPGIVPVQNFKQAPDFAARCGASVPDWLARALRGPRRRSGDAQAGRGRGRRRAGARPRRSRRHRFPLLHHEPRRSRLRRSAICSACGRAGGGTADAGRLTDDAVKSMQPNQDRDIAPRRRGRDAFWCSTAPWAR